MSSTPVEPSQRTSEHLQDLLGLARPQTDEDQQILLMGLADLFEDQSRPKPEAVSEVFLRLARQAENAIRQALAERLASADWAPRELVKLLAQDEIEIARPVILQSPLLDDEDLLDLLTQASLEHQVHVAQRACLTSRPVKQILDQGRPAVVIALASNPTALVDGHDMARFLDLSQSITALKPPLARHPALSQAMAMKLMPWLSDALQQVIQIRFNLDSASLTQAMTAATQLAQGLAVSADDATAERLIHKLHAADQLRPAYLIRAAREGRLNLFAYGLAALGDYPVDHVYRALKTDSARPLFLACTSVGVDRAAFGTLLASVQSLNNGLPRDVDGMAKTLANRSKDQARLEFRTLMNGLSAGSV